MSQNRALRTKDVAAYLRVSHQRAAQMYAEGKLPEPAEIDRIGPLWKPAKIEHAPSGRGGNHGVGGGGPDGASLTVPARTTTLTLC